MNDLKFTTAGDYMKTNERIRELIDDAKLTAVSEMFEDDLQKFAQLIVRECAEVAHCNFHVDGLTLGGIMKKHFGVEE